MRVQELVRLVAVRFAEEFLVNLLHERVFVGLAVLELVSVRVVQNGRTERAQIHIVADNCRLDRLTTAVDASARARHDLDELHVVGAVFHAL